MSADMSNAMANGYPSNRARDSLGIGGSNDLAFGHDGREVGPVQKHFVRKYTGSDTICEVSGLNPYTTYTFRLQVWIIYPLL